jgi:hypothetical protein
MGLQQYLEIVLPGENKQDPARVLEGLAFL